MPIFAALPFGSLSSFRWLLLLAALLGALPAAAHDVPNDVRVQAFLEPRGQALQLLLRVPLAAMQEVDFPRRGPGYLDLARAEPALRTAAQLWLADNLSLFEEDRRLPAPRLVLARVSLPSDRSFASLAQARAHLAEPPLPETLELYWNQGLLDVLFEFPIRSERSAFAIEPRLARLGLQVVTSLLLVPSEGAPRAFEFHGNPGLVRLDPRWHQAALRFVRAGFWHILDGRDHLLFILCLVLPLRRLKPLALIVTAFTLAHSVTLIAAALGAVPDALWFVPLVETLIAASIVFMALDNIVGGSLGRRWMLASGFGLVHGLGFSFVLRDTLQFAGHHVLTALVAFNVGVELGQLLVLLLAVPLLDALFRRVLPERIGILVISALVAHTGWHWLTERGEQLAKFPWPGIGSTAAINVLRALTALLLVLTLAWLWRLWRQRRKA